MFTIQSKFQMHVKLFFIRSDLILLYFFSNKDLNMVRHVHVLKEQHIRTCWHNFSTDVGDSYSIVANEMNTSSYNLYIYLVHIDHLVENTFTKNLEAEVGFWTIASMNNFISKRLTTVIIHLREFFMTKEEN